MADLSFLTDMPQTDGLTTEGGRGFLDKIAESFKRGEEDTLADVAVANALMDPEKEDVLGTLIARKKLQQKEALDPIEGRYVMNLLYKSADSAGALWETTKRSLIGGTAEAAGGAVLGTVVPGIGTAAGASIGWSVGTFVGAASFMYRQGMGAMYADMIEQGIDPHTAKTAAMLGALPYSLVGTLPLRALGGPAKRILTGTVEPALEKAALSAVLKGVSTYAKGLTSVIGAAEAQSIIEIATEKAAKSYQEGGINIDKEFLADTGTKLVDTFKQAAAGGLLLPIPGAVAEGLVHNALFHVNNEVEKSLNKRDNVTQIKPGDVSDMQMKASYFLRQKMQDAAGLSEHAGRTAYDEHVRSAQSRSVTPKSYEEFMFDKSARRLHGLQEEVRAPRASRAIRQRSRSDSG